MEEIQRVSWVWLQTYMFAGDGQTSNPIDITEFFASHTGTLSHSRAIGIDKCIDLGLKVFDLRDSTHKELSDKIWGLWCLYEVHFERTGIHKIYENSAGCLLQRQSFQISLPNPAHEPVNE